MKGDDCLYAVLDTSAKTLTFKRLDEGLMWINDCDDVQTWEDDVYCLILKDRPMNLYLIKNAVYLDTLLQGKPYGWTDYTKVGFAGDMLNLGNNICMIVDDRFSCVGVSIRGALEYMNENGISVIY
ncbi:MAG: hypothetical protein SPL52_13505 [Fibrobacter sp.]|nr:hypothetical protein [Fibrobacter sp.]